MDPVNPPVIFTKKICFASGIPTKTQKIRKHLGSIEKICKNGLTNLAIECIICGIF